VTYLLFRRSHILLFVVGEEYNVSHIYLLIHNSAANIMYPSQLSESLSNLNCFKMKYKTKQYLRGIDIVTFHALLRQR
jgi:hypothetical protein